MKTSRITRCPVNRRGGQTSWLLNRSDRLAVTWVEGAIGSEQPLHSHDDSEQVYVIVQGTGLMTVEHEKREVHRGTAVVIPPGAEHAIRSVGQETLVYVSA